MKYTVTLANKVNSAGDEERITEVIDVGERDNAFDIALDCAVAASVRDNKPYLVVGLERGDN